MKILRTTLSFALAAITAASCSFAGLSRAAAAGMNGDINADGKINSSDALIALEVAVAKRELDAELTKIADIDANGTVNSADALLILQKSVGQAIALKSFKLDKGNQTVGIGSKITAAATSFVPTIADDTAVVWSSSSNDVATVDENGNVTAVSVGKAVITATAHDGSGVTSSFELTVGAKAQSIELCDSWLYYRQGKVYHLSAEVLPENTYNKNVVWSSDDSDIASVDQDGNVHFNMIGTTTVRCKTTDGSDLSATCSVKVGSLPIPYVNQKPDYPTGCEAASSCMLLKYYGFDITMKQMVNIIPRENLYKKNGKLYGPDINEKFVGDPTGYYTSEHPGYGVFSPAVTKALQQAIDERGGGYTAVKISGCSFAELKHQISTGHPAIVWATYKMQNPTKVNSWYIDTTGEYFEYPRGTHVMILAGFDKDTVEVVDPYGNGIQHYDMDLFEARWNLLGKQAIVLEAN